MVQEEVSDRIISRHNSKIFGSISCIFQTFYNIEKFASLSPNVFSPRPKVRSALLNFSKKLKKSDILIKKNVFDLYLKFIQFCFFERRKILLKYLEKHFLVYFLKFVSNEKILNFCNFENISIFFKTNNIDFNSRPENLSCKNFLDLLYYLFNIEKLF